MVKAAPTIVSRKSTEADVEDDIIGANRPTTEIARASVLKARMVNRQKTLLVTSRGTTSKYRHLMVDFHRLMPHCKKDSKLDIKKTLVTLNEIADLSNCNNIFLMETRKHQDLYIWMGKAIKGPCIQFFAENVVTMDELRLTGNCLKGTRPLLSFDASFDESPERRLMKEILTQCLGTPKGHPRSRPFHDRVLTFSFVDGKIWLRNYQMIKNPDVHEKQQRPFLVEEIGPRAVLTPIRILEGSFFGKTIYHNESFVNPNEARRNRKSFLAMAYTRRQEANKVSEERRMAQVPEPSELADWIDA